MKAKRTPSIQVMLSIGFIVIAAIFITSLMVSYRGMVEIHESEEDLYSDNFDNLTNLLTLRSNLNAERLDVSVMLSTTKQSWTTWEWDLNSRTASDSIVLRRLNENLSDDPVQGKNLRALDSVYREYNKVRASSVLPLIHEGRTTEAERLFFGAQLSRHVMMREILRQLERVEESEARNRIAAANSEIAVKLWVFTLLGAISVCAVAVFAFFMTRAVSRQFEERKRMESGLRGVNRQLEMLNLCNGIAIHSQNEEELLRETCSVLVRTGGYKLAWVGYAQDDEEKSVRPESFAGTDGEYVHGARISWGDNDRGRGPTGTCIRTGKVIVNRDTATHPHYDPWRKTAIEKGYNSSATLPLIDGQRAYGALMVYSEQTDAFDETEIRLLTELADDLAHATLGIRNRCALVQAEERSRSASIYSRSLIEASLDPLVTIDREGKITDVNEATEKITGRGRDELIGTDFADYFTDPEKARRGYMQVLKDGSVVDYELELKHKDGRVTLVSYNATVYRGAQGSVAGTFAAARDITSRRLAEEGLRASEEKFRALGEAMSEGVLIHESGKIVESNSRMEEILGRGRDEIIGKSILDFVHPGFKDLVDGRVQHPQDTAVEFSFARPDGSEVMVVGLAHACVYLGRPMRVAAYRDVTIERRNEQRLRAASKYARSLIEASLDPLVTISAEGKITDVNESTEKITGKSRELLIGSDFCDYFTEPDKAREGYKKVLSEGLVRDYPLTIKHSSGKTTDVLYNATVYRNEDGELQGVFAAARDVTERKKNEEALRNLLDDLARSNAELEQFAYVASHDLQEPLRMVSSYTQLLAKRYGDRLDKDANDFIGFAVDGASRLQVMINDLLEYSRVGTRGKPMEQADMNVVLGQALLNLASSIDESHAIISNTELPTVRCDPAQLVRVFQNLIGNSIKFRAETSPRIHVSSVSKSGVHEFTVKDNGIGIPPEYRERIFQIFQRLHGKREYPGTGIGLAICRRIVERHGGRIWVESAPGEGSAFHFTIPESA